MNHAPAAPTQPPHDDDNEKEIGIEHRRRRSVLAKMKNMKSFFLSISLALSLFPHMMMMLLMMTMAVMVAVEYIINTAKFPPRLVL